MAGDILDNRGTGDASWRWPAVHSEGLKFGGIAAAIALSVMAFVSPWLGWPLVGIAVFVFAFFRDPERVVPKDDAAIVAPADGLVTLIEQVEPPLELQLADAEGQKGLGNGSLPASRSSCRCSMCTLTARPSAAWCGVWSISLANL